MNEPPIADRLELLEQEVTILQAEVLRLAKKNYPQFLTVEEVADMLRVTRGTVDNWVSARKIPFRKAGGATIFMLTEIIEWTRPERLRKVG